MVEQNSSLKRRVLAGVVVTVIVFALPHAAFSQSAAPGSVVVLKEIVVEGRRIGGEETGQGET